MNELLEVLRKALDNMSSVDLLCGDAASLQPILDAIPNNWGKVNNRWVELEKPTLHKNEYDLIEADWGKLNDALVDGRIRILPFDTFCICDPKEDIVCALHGRDNG